MVKITVKKLAKNPIWGGGIFNHTIILNKYKNTRELDLK